MYSFCFRSFPKLANNFIHKISAQVLLAIISCFILSLFIFVGVATAVGIRRVALGVTRIILAVLISIIGFNFVSAVGRVIDRRFLQLARLLFNFDLI